MNKVLTENEKVVLEHQIPLYEDYVAEVGKNLTWFGRLVYNYKTISKHFLGMQIKMLVQKQYALCSKRLIAMPSMPQQPVLEISIAVLRAEDMMQ